MTDIPAADAYIFDIDGTLLVTRDFVHWNALHQAMVEAYGVDATIESIQYHGKTDLSILRTALARARVSDGRFKTGLPRALEIVRHEVEANYHDLKPIVCHGVLEMLA